MIQGQPWLGRLATLVTQSYAHEPIDGIEQRGDDPVLIMLDQLGGWPVLDGQDSSAQDDEFDWIALLGRMRQYGFNHNILFKMEPQQDPVNMSINMLTVSVHTNDFID